MFDRGGFSEFLLPGSNKSHTVDALEMYGFFAGTTAGRNRGEPSYSHLQGLLTTTLLVNIGDILDSNLLGK